MDLVEDISLRLREIYDEIRAPDFCTNVRADIKSILLGVSQMRTLCIVVSRFQGTFSALRLSNYSGRRLKHFLDFLYGKTKRTTRDTDGKIGQIEQLKHQLRKLSTAAKLFLAHCYVVHELRDLTNDELDCVLLNIEGFVNEHRVLQYLGQDNISRTINRGYSFANDAAFKSFKKSYIDEVPSARSKPSEGHEDDGMNDTTDHSSTIPSPLISAESGGLRDLGHSVTALTRKACNSCGATQGIEVQDQSTAIPRSFPVVENVPNPHIQFLQQIGRALPSKRYLAFSTMPASRIERLPLRLRNGVKQTDLWNAERRNEYGVTSCVTMFLPRSYADCFALIRLGHDEGFTAAKFWGIGGEGVVRQRSNLC